MISAYSATERSEVKTPFGSAPAVIDSRALACCGSQFAAGPVGPLNIGM